MCTSRNLVLNFNVSRELRPRAQAIHFTLAEGVPLEIRVVPRHIRPDHRDLDGSVDLIVDGMTLTLEEWSYYISPGKNHDLRDGHPQAVPARLEVQLEPLPGGDENMYGHSVRIRQHEPDFGGVEPTRALDLQFDDDRLAHRERIAGPIVSIEKGECSQAAVLVRPSPGGHGRQVDRGRCRGDPEVALDPLGGRAVVSQPA